MSNSDNPPIETRPVSSTENSWCRAVPTGTGITVFSLLLTKPPPFSLLQTAIKTTQTNHPILLSNLHYNPLSTSFSFTLPPLSLSSSCHVASFDPQSTARIIDFHPNGSHVDPLHAIIEHEINENPWSEVPVPHGRADLEERKEGVLYVSVYELHGGRWVLCVKVHTGACDRVGAVQVVKEVMAVLKSEARAEIEEREMGLGLGLGVEECVGSGKMSKPFWARGLDMLGYSLNSFRLSNLEYLDPDSTRVSRVVRLGFDSHRTDKLIEECKIKGIKICGVLSAAALMAARLSKQLAEGVWEKYAVATLVDCRSLLEPPLSNHDVGFYHSAILNTHDINGSEELWDLARRTYTSFSDAKKSNKHFTDMADLNFLMCRAIENPGLTPSSSLRTSFISVFEEPIPDDEEANKMNEELGIEDYLGCASTHGVGPSMAIFDTIRHGKLDCACVYPFPLHSREQMQGVIDNMKRIIIDSL